MLRCWFCFKLGGPVQYFVVLGYSLRLEFMDGWGVDVGLLAAVLDTVGGERYLVTV